MQFCKLNIVLAVLVFFFDHIRSAPQHYAPVADPGVDDSDEGVYDADERVNDADQGVDDANEGVDDADEGVDDDYEGVSDADEGVNDADEGVNDADEGVGKTAVKAPQSVCLQEHEEYEECRSNCPDNCDNYMNPVRPCTMQCEPGCNCKKGYVRNLKDNTCIKPEQCHKSSHMSPYSGSDQCKPGQYFYTNGCNICYCYAEGTQGCTDILCNMDSKLTLLGNSKQMQAYKKLRDTATSCVPGEKFKSNGCNCKCVIPSVMTCDKNCVNQ